MNDIYSLLSINKDIFQEFQFQYNLLDEKWIEKVIDRNIRSLKRIEDMCSPGEYVPSKPLIINAIANKVRKSLSLSNADKTRWNPMELRTMSYNLETVLILFDKFIKHDLNECDLYHGFRRFSKEFIIDG